MSSLADVVAGFQPNPGNASIRPDIVDVFRRDWERLGSPGSWHTGAQRLDIAAEYRLARAARPAEHDLPGPALAATRKVAADPATIDAAWVDNLVAEGLPVNGYVEIVGVVSRIAAVDSFHRVLGYDLPPLPAPIPGPPTGEVNESAKPSKGFVPMVRGTSIWWALTLVPEAYEAMDEFHCILYLSPEEMQSATSPRALRRPEMELIASRASALNGCFY